MLAFFSDINVCGSQIQCYWIHLPTRIPWRNGSAVPNHSYHICTLTPLSPHANDRETELQTSKNEEANRVPFTLTYHPQNLTIKNVILKNFKILRNDAETKHIFPLPPLVSFKRDKNPGNFLVRSVFKSDNQPGTFKSTRTRCKTCPFISNMVKISGPNRCSKIIDHFTCISVNVICCITCTPCKKIYIGEAGRRLGDHFREHLRDVEINDTDTLKPVARPFNLPNHSHHNMTISGLFLHHGDTDSCKNLSTGYTLSARNQ